MRLTSSAATAGDGLGLMSAVGEAAADGERARHQILPWLSDQSKPLAASSNASRLNQVMPPSMALGRGLHT